MFVVGDVEIPRVLLDRRITERRLRNSELMVGKERVLDKFVCVVLPSASHTNIHHSETHISGRTPAQKSSRSPSICESSH